MTLTTAAKISAVYMLAVILCGMASGVFPNGASDVDDALVTASR